MGKSRDISVSGSCRYLDKGRRVYIPAHVLAEAEISIETTLYFEAVNGCILIKPVVGIAVRDHEKRGKISRKGKWDAD